jgi:oxalate decarboxylase/phosphoglucose isomerase-like protein (cupin superfamily)
MAKIIRTMQTFFNGKVQVRTLLVIDQSAGRTEVLARLVSPGGELTVLTDGTIPIHHLCYVELREGKPRGNHYHKLRHESFYVISGELEFRIQDLATSERIAITMRPGDLARIDPEIVHTFIPITSGHALEFAPERFDAGDVYRIS